MSSGIAIFNVPPRGILMEKDWTWPAQGTSDPNTATTVLCGRNFMWFTFYLTHPSHLTFIFLVTFIHFDYFFGGGEVSTIVADINAFCTLAALWPLSCSLSPPAVNTCRVWASQPVKQQCGFPTWCSRSAEMKAHVLPVSHTPFICEYWFVLIWTVLKPHRSAW